MTMKGPYRTRLHPDYMERARWHDYYAPGAYLVTFGAAKGAPLLGRITGGDAAGPRCRLTDTGALIDAEIRRLPLFYPQLVIPAHIVMPDHVHVVMGVRQRSDKHLGAMVGSLKANCTKALRQLGYAGVLFAPGFNDKIALKADDSDNFVRYVRDNPRRAWLRMTHGGFFDRSCVLTIDGAEYEVFGNILLLREPVIEAVRVSRRYTAAELAARQRAWVEAIRCGGVLVSPFIHPSEREVREQAISGGASLIVLSDRGLGERYKPSGRYFELCAEGRLLIVATRAYDTRATPLRRGQCLAMNELAAKIASGHAALTLKA